MKIKIKNQDREELRNIQSKPDKNGWMDIESAPQDGQEILVYNKNQNVFYLYSFNTVRKYWQSKGKLDLHFQFTHWQPRPEPPEG